MVGLGYDVLIPADTGDNSKKVGEKEMMDHKLGNSIIIFRMHFCNITFLQYAKSQGSCFTQLL